MTNDDNTVFDAGDRIYQLSDEVDPAANQAAMLRYAQWVADNHDKVKVLTPSLAGERATHSPRAVVPRVVEGEVLYHVGDIRMQVVVDPELLQRVDDILDRAVRSISGHARRVTPLDKTDENNIIDQE